MCGIYGIAGATGPHDEPLVRDMDELLYHRGPDESGARLGPLGWMGMRRLAIVDLTTGSQPMHNEARDVWVVFNGEIYNYADLRQELIAAGHTFLTHSDTETIVHGYEEWGDAVVDRLSGMFAFAIFDERRNRVVFARDHIGKKPLYLWPQSDRIAFASEIKAIAADPRFVKRMNGEAFWHYLTFKNVPAPLSIFEGVVQLPQGSIAVWERGELTVREYWRPSFTGGSALSEEEAAEELLRLLRAAVHSRMVVSDVPVGCYLSGGIDSSMIVTLAMEGRTTPIQTFSLGYEEEIAHKGDIPFARMMAKRLGTNHHELFLHADDVLEALPHIVDAFDEPFGAVTSTYYLSSLIRKYVKVAVAGDGADELFGSYAAHRMASVLPGLRAGGSSYAWFDGNRALADRCAADPDYVWRTRFAAFTDAEKRELVTESNRFADSAELLRPFYARASCDDLVNATLEVECRTLLPDQVLTFVDRLSMQHSVEVRAPFLDRSIVAFAASLPGSMKVRHDETKAVLKRAARKILPAEIVDRKKVGFVLPIDAWLSTAFRPLVLEVTSPPWLDHGYFNKAVVDRFVNEHLSGAADHTYKVWSLVMFQLWYAKMMRGQDIGSSTAASCSR